MEINEKMKIVDGGFSSERINLSVSGNFAVNKVNGQDDKAKNSNLEFPSDLY